MTQTLTQMTEKERLSVKAGTSLKNVVSGDILYDWINQRNLLVTQISPFYVNLVFRNGLSRTPVTVETRKVIDMKYTDIVLSSQIYDSNSPDDVLRARLFQVADKYLLEAGL